MVAGLEKKTFQLTAHARCRGCRAGSPLNHRILMPAPGSGGFTSESKKWRLKNGVLLQL